MAAFSFRNCFSRSSKGEPAASNSSAMSPVTLSPGIVLDIRLGAMRLVAGALIGLAAGCGIMLFCLRAIMPDVAGEPVIGTGLGRAWVGRVNCCGVDRAPRIGGGFSGSPNGLAILRRFIACLCRAFISHLLPAQ